MVLNGQSWNGPCLRDLLSLVKFIKSLLFRQSRVMASDREGTFPKSVYHVCWCWVWRVDNDRSIFLPTTGWWKAGVSWKVTNTSRTWFTWLNQRHTTMSTNTTHANFAYKCFKKKMLIFLCGYIRDIEKHLHFTIHWDPQFSSSFFRYPGECYAQLRGNFSSEKLDRRNPIQVS